MSKLARGTALVGAAVALAATVSPVAHADDRGSASKSRYIELKAFEEAPIYKEATSNSRRVGTFMRGETARVWCYLKTSGGVWYSVQDAGGALWTYSGHFESSGEIKKC